jgi:hypothetical protein
VAGAVAALMLALHRGDRPPAAPPAAGPAAVPEASARRPPALPPAEPAVPAKSPALPTTTSADAPLDRAFADEPRDVDWARDQELAIRNRLRPLLDAANRGRPGTVAVPQVACHQVHCRLLITGSDEREFLAFVEQLQGERGFYGDASQLSLHGYGLDKQSQPPTHQVGVYLRYAR